MEISAQLDRLEEIRSDSAQREVHDARTATVLGIALGVSFAVCFATGVWSHLQQHPPSWLELPLGRTRGQPEHPAAARRPEPGDHARRAGRPRHRRWHAEHTAIDAAHRAGGRPVIVMERAATGELFELAVHSWEAPATDEEHDMLDGLRPTVLDIGCGPGRIAAALAERGTPALGIDVSPAALQTASDAGAIVLERSVFDRLPGEGRWGSVLLLDGNIGIGGEPVQLLTRLRQLTSSNGAAIVEVEPPGTPLVRDRVRLLCAHDEPGPWFSWAWVGADDIVRLASAAGFGSCSVVCHGDRYVAELTGLAVPTRRAPLQQQGLRR